MASLPQCSCACGTGAGTSRRIFSLATDACLLDDLAPLFVLRAEEAGKFFWRLRHQLDALRRELRLYVVPAQHMCHLGVYFLHDVGRHLRRHEESQPRIARVAGQHLADGRRVAEIREAPRRRAAEEPELAILDMLQK